VKKYKSDIQELRKEKLELQKEKEDLDWRLNLLIENAEDLREKLEQTENHLSDLEEAALESQRIIAELRRHNDLLQDELAAWKPVGRPPRSCERFSTDRQG